MNPRSKKYDNRQRFFIAAVHSTVEDGKMWMIMSRIAFQSWKNVI